MNKRRVEVWIKVVFTGHGMKPKRRDRATGVLSMNILGKTKLNQISQ